MMNKEGSFKSEQLRGNNNIKKILRSYAFKK